MIYEYRVYEAVPGKLPELHDRFRHHAVRLFERHGMRLVGFWTPEIGDYNDRVIYILAFQDLEERQRAWDAFKGDPEWQKVKAETEAGGPLVARITNTVLTPTDYSPLK